MLKSLREIKSQGQKITAITDYGADVCLAEYASPEETEKALLELTKDIYQKRGKMNEDDSNVFCLGILMALSTVWADRPGFAEKMETVKIGVKPKNYKGVVT